ncbi:MAG: large conductance mechanosensitive channel protein MscL [Bacteroidota bacterium]|jgi:large conductance mechanosensitive channel
MGLFKEFKNFLMQGNVLELAVAVIIGAAFGSIVSSLVDHIITPLLLTPALEAAQVDNIEKLHWGAVKYGNFLSSIIKFLLTAFVLFLTLRTMNKISKNNKAADQLPAPSETDQLLTEIRDLLKNKQA